MSKNWILFGGLCLILLYNQCDCSNPKVPKGKPQKPAIAPFAVTNPPPDFETPLPAVDITDAMVQSAQEKGFDLLESMLTKLKNGETIDINEPDATLEFPTALHQAVVLGQADIVEQLLNQKADIAVKDDIGQTPLHIAAQQGKIDVVETLLQHQAPVNATDDAGQTALHMAVQLGQIDMVRLLLENGANPSIKSNGFLIGRPLHLLVTGANSARKKLLKKKNTFRNVDNNLTVSNPGLGLSSEKRIEMFNLLLEYGANIRETDEAKNTLLHMAACTGWKEMVELLFSKQMDVNELNQPGRTPLHFAAGSDNKDVFEFLIAKGAKPNLQDGWGNAPLHYAVLEQKPDIVKSLLAKGVHQGLRNGMVHTPLDQALLYNADIKNLEIFLQKEPKATRNAHWKQAILNRAMRYGEKNATIEAAEKEAKASGEHFYEPEYAYYQKSLQATPAQKQERLQKIEALLDQLMHAT